MERIKRTRMLLDWWEELVPNLKHLTHSLADDLRKEIEEYELQQ